MYDVWLVMEKDGRYSPVTKVPQDHISADEGFLCACRMIKLLGAEAIQAKNVNVMGVHPSNCILVFDPSQPLYASGAPHDREPLAAVVVGASLTDDDGEYAFEGTKVHTAHKYWN